MFGVWGSPARFLNRHLEIRDNSGAFGIRGLFNPLKNNYVKINIGIKNANNYKDIKYGPFLGRSFYIDISTKIIKKLFDIY